MRLTGVDCSGPDPRILCDRGRVRASILLAFVIITWHLQPRASAHASSVTVQGFDVLSPPTSSSYPSDLTASNGLLFFAADDGHIGQQLWRSDGTVEGTMLVKAVRQDVSNATTAIENLTDVNGLLFFTVDATTYTEVPYSGFRTVALWKSAGTEAGTVKLREFDSTTSWATAALLAAGDKILFFVVDDGVHGHELWRSDGREAGTILVKDIRPGTGDGVVSSGFHDFLSVNGLLFFHGDDGSGGQGLWKSDGTEAGTVLVRGFSQFGGPFSFAAFNRLLYFGVSDYTVDQFQLWRSDGTDEGTQLVQGLPAGVMSSSMGQLTALSGMLFFVVADHGPGDALWRTDGTASGTVLVRHLDYGPSQAVAANTALFFLAPYPFPPGSALWKSDGTAGGTAPVSRIYDGVAQIPYLDSLAAFDGGVVFTTAAGGLWRSDGTQNGTVPVHLFVARPANFQPVNDTMFFAADDGGTGYELWKTDGTDTGTTLVKDINTVPAPTPTPAPFPPCTGDCDRDGFVTVDDILTGVGIALGTAPFETCRAIDVDANGSVTVDELLAAVHNLLAGCPRNSL
jgi:ELWxxDGT repeat protein